MDQPYILIAEDNSGDISLLRLGLTEHGVDLPVMVQTDGERAMNFLESIDGNGPGYPALMVLDLNLPKINGRELLERMRQLTDRVSFPVVVFSSSDSERDKQDALGLGATKYLRKPSNLDDFLEVGKLLK